MFLGVDIRRKKKQEIGTGLKSVAKYYHCILISNILLLKLEPFQGSFSILILFAIYIESLRDSFGNSIKKHPALSRKKKKVVYLRNGFVT